MLQGSNIFTGLQVHAKDFTDASIAAGKRVVIIGAGKTALVGPGRTPPCPVLAWGAWSTALTLCWHAANMLSVAHSMHATGLCRHKLLQALASSTQSCQFHVVASGSTPAPPMCPTVSP